MICVEDIDQVACQLLDVVVLQRECFDFKDLEEMSGILIFSKAEMIFRTRKLISEFRFHPSYFSFAFF